MRGKFTRILPFLVKFLPIGIPLSHLLPRIACHARSRRTENALRFSLRALPTSRRADPRCRPGNSGGDLRIGLPRPRRAPGSPPSQNCGTATGISSRMPTAPRRRLPTARLIWRSPAAPAIPAGWSPISTPAPAWARSSRRRRPTISLPNWNSSTISPRVSSKAANRKPKLHPIVGWPARPTSSTTSSPPGLSPSATGSPAALKPIPSIDGPPSCCGGSWRWRGSG